MNAAWTFAGAVLIADSALLTLLTSAPYELRSACLAVAKLPDVMAFSTSRPTCELPFSSLLMSWHMELPGLEPLLLRVLGRVVLGLLLAVGRGSAHRGQGQCDPDDPDGQTQPRTTVPHCRTSWSEEQLWWGRYSGQSVPQVAPGGVDQFDAD